MKSSFKEQRVYLDGKIKEGEKLPVFNAMKWRQK